MNRVFARGGCGEKRAKVTREGHESNMISYSYYESNKSREGGRDPRYDARFFRGFLGVYYICTKVQHTRRAIILRLATFS